MSLTAEARKLAGSVADDIVRLGHFRGPYGRYNAPGREDAPCCVVQAPSIVGTSEMLRDEYFRLLKDATGTDSILQPRGVIDWNDHHTGAEVLEMLRGVEAG